MYLLEKRLRTYLEGLESYEPIIRAVVAMIPSREFTRDSIQEGNYRDYTNTIKRFVTEGRLNQDRVSYLALPQLLADYDEVLETEANQERKWLVFGLLMQDKDKQVDVIIKICRDYRLGKRLLERKEEFRVLEKE